MSGRVGDVMAEAPPAVVAGARVGEEAEKDKKKKRRQNRRPKQNLAGLPGSGCSSVEGSCGQVAEWLENGNGIALKETPEKPFKSLPTMHINGYGSVVESLPAGGKGGKISTSCPLPAASSHGRSPSTNTARKKYFPQYWSDQAVKDGIEKGQVFKATFRVNAHNRLEAYCTIEGLSIDVLVNGVVAQNRAIEGDTVAVTLDPVSSWTKLKGSIVPSNPANADDLNILDGVREVTSYRCVKEENFAAASKDHFDSNGVLPLERGYNYSGSLCASDSIQLRLEKGIVGSDPRFSGHSSTSTESSGVGPWQPSEAERALGRICTMLRSYPSKRPTAKVVAVIKKSPRRGAVIGFLAAQQWLFEVEGDRKKNGGIVSDKNKKPLLISGERYMQLIATDPKFPKMMVNVNCLPGCVKDRLNNGDVTVESELIAAQIDEWCEESVFPYARVVHVLGRGGDIEPQVAATVFENAICAANFSSESLACLPDAPWQIPVEEIETRKDLRHICTFTIDPSSAIDLDDALSVEQLSDDIYRVGVHIADVSYFVSPDTALDTEAQIRSTSVYMLQHKIPMLPPTLSEDLGSLNPGVDRLAFSLIWDINSFGHIVDRWIGRTVIRSCCKLSYDFVQNLIDGSLDADQLGAPGILSPQIHGQFGWKDVAKSLRSLHQISLRMRDMRFKDGALSLENPKVFFMFDEYGTPYDSFLNQRKDSCSLVEEFMLLANRSVAEVISRAFPDCALLRRHPEPNQRKLKEFEAFCSKHGFELDTSSSGRLQLSLSRIREKLENDPILFSILVSYSSKPMQSAMYFCTGDLRGMENDWSHYALSVPLYTHFTSPLRRYPDIIVHRTLSAAVEAEEIYLKQRMISSRADECGVSDFISANRCFTGLYFDKDAAESKEGREAFLAAAFRTKVPSAKILSEVAAYCNERKSASRHAEEAGQKLYLWAFLKTKECLVSEARVLGLGPRFMSVYIHKLAMERRIYYDDIEGLSVEWLDTTCTLVLDLLQIDHFPRRYNPGRARSIDDVVMLMDPSEVLVLEERKEATEVGCLGASLLPSSPSVEDGTDPAFFPLTLRLLSSVPVALHAIGGDDGPLDIGVKLYMCSYRR